MASSGEGGGTGGDVEGTFCLLIPPLSDQLFDYMGRVLAAEDDDWSEVVCHLRHARKYWARLVQILSREGRDARKMGQIYLAVVQPVLLYWSDTRLLKPYRHRLLGRFHHKVARRLTRQQPQKGRNGG